MKNVENPFIVYIENQLKDIVQRQLSLKGIEKAILDLSQSISQEMLSKRSQIEEYKELAQLHSSILAFEHPILKAIEQKLIEKLRSEISILFDVKESIEYLDSQFKENSSLTPEQKKEKIKNMLSSIEDFAILKLSPIFRMAYYGFTEQNKLSIMQTLNFSYQEIQEEIKIHFSQESFWPEIQAHFHDNRITQLINMSNSAKIKEESETIPLSSKEDEQFSLQENTPPVDGLALVNSVVINNTEVKSLPLKEITQPNDSLSQSFATAFKDIEVEALEIENSNQSSEIPMNQMKLNNLDTNLNQEVTTTYQSKTSIPYRDDQSPNRAFAEQDVFEAEGIVDKTSVSPEFYFSEKESLPQTPALEINNSPIQQVNQSEQYDPNLSEAFNKLRANLKNIKS